MRFSDLVGRQQVKADLKAESKHEVLEALAALLSSASGGTVDSEDVFRTLLDREKLRSTGVGSGVAIPHGKVPGLERLAMAVGVSHEGIDFDSTDGRPVHLFMALAAPVGATGEHLKALARIARVCSDEGFRRELTECRSDDEVYDALVAEDGKH